MEIVKKHKFTFITLAVLLVIFIITFLILRLVMPDYGKGYYGNRLNGIDNYKISNDTINRVKSEVSGDGIESVTYHLEGRIINITITVKPDLELDKAKESANKLLEIFTKDELEYYDLQVFLVSSSESENYPKIGYKHKTSDAIVWSA